MLILLVISITWLMLVSFALMLCAMARSADSEMSETRASAELGSSASVVRLHDSAA